MVIAITLNTILPLHAWGGGGGSEQALQYLRKAWMGIKMKFLYLSLEHTELVYTDNVVIVLMSSWVRTPDSGLVVFQMIISKVRDIWS